MLEYHARFNDENRLVFGVRCPHCGTQQQPDEPLHVDLTQPVADVADAITNEVHARVNEHVAGRAHTCPGCGAESSAGEGPEEWRMAATELAELLDRAAA